MPTIYNNSNTLINKRNYSFQFLPVKLIGELLLVTQVDGVGARHKVAATEPEEQCARPRPGEQCKAQPLGYLAEIIG